MSAIIGMWCLDGRPVVPDDLDRMMAAVAHRGPDGGGVWSEGAVGLGHRMLHTTRESLAERLPLASGAARLVLTSDARIDNREELISQLGLGDRPPDEIPDSALILAAYERWGSRCPEKLLGDFAFAIWDGRRQTLFCARDHFGVKPFYYHSSQRVFVFGSEIKALLRLPEVPRRLNESRIADYFAECHQDRGSTFYEGILRLPPGHSLTVDREGARLHCYYALDPTRELRLSSSEEYAGQFRDLFTEAVRCRLRCAHPLGSLLSGGLDSSSIACVARGLLAKEDRLPLPTFSLAFDKVTACDERRYVEAVLALGGFEPHSVPGDHLDPVRELDRMLWHQDEPGHAGQIFLQWGLRQAARERGIRVILDGHDGDGTVSYGYGYLDELARAGRWATFAAEVRALDRNLGLSSWRSLRIYARRYAVNPIVCRYRTLQRIEQIGGAVCRRVRGEMPAEPPWWRANLNPEFIHGFNLAERFQIGQKEWPRLHQNERERHYRTLAVGHQTAVLEELDRTAAAFSMEPRYPFWDKRLIEFCLAMPAAEKLQRGWPRIVLRRAMAGILPPEVQWRGPKTDFSPNWRDALIVRARASIEELLATETPAERPYVDMQALRQAYRQLAVRKPPLPVTALPTFWRPLLLAAWLRRAWPTG